MIHQLDIKHFLCNFQRLLKRTVNKGNVAFSMSKCNKNWFNKNRFHFSNNKLSLKLIATRRKAIAFRKWCFTANYFRNVSINKQCVCWDRFYVLTSEIPLHNYIGSFAHFRTKLGKKYSFESKFVLLLFHYQSTFGEQNKTVLCLRISFTNCVCWESVLGSLDSNACIEWKYWLYHSNNTTREWTKTANNLSNVMQSTAINVQMIENLEYFSMSFALQLFNPIESISPTTKMHIQNRMHSAGIKDKCGHHKNSVESTKSQFTFCSENRLKIRKEKHFGHG